MTFSFEMSFQSLQIIFDVIIVYWMIVIVVYLYRRL